MIFSILEDPKTHVDISSFLENDLMSCFLFNNFNSEDIITNSNKLFTFLLDISGMLERIQPKKFPENSLFFAETFQRGMQLMQKNSQTFEQNVGYLKCLVRLIVSGVYLLTIFEQFLYCLDYFEKRFSCIASGQLFVVII